MLLKLLEAHAKADVEQRVIAMLPGGVMSAPMRAVGVQVDELNFLGGIPPLSGALGVARIARRYAPDLVQGWLYHGNLGAALASAALPRRVPLVWGVRQSLSSLKGENLLARLAIAMNRAASPFPDRLLFNSRVSLEQHRTRGFAMKNAQYIPNGFDTERFAPDVDLREQLRTVWNVRIDSVVFGLFARYHPAKGYADFLRAARLVSTARPSARFVIAGTGADEHNGALINEIRNAGLDGRVRLMGEQHEVAKLLPALDLYVSPSVRIEAFSNSVGEAMSCGLPCIVTDVGDSPLVVGDSGLVVSPGAPERMAEAMIEMIDIGASARARLGARARERIVAEFEIGSVARRYLDLYESLVMARRQAV